MREGAKLPPKSHLLLKDPPMTPVLPPLRPSRIELFLFRAAIKEPIVTSFGSIPGRVALLVRIEDDDGAHGWGEVWGNFPPTGVEHKARLIDTIIAPMVLGHSWTTPEAAWLDLTARLRRNAIQSGEPGNFAACLAGVDVAFWDLAGRKAGMPLWQALGRADAPAPLLAYASNLNPKGAPQVVAQCRERGYRAFKMKVGFDLASDLGNVRRIVSSLKTNEHFMIDANQAWDLGSARIAVEAFSQYPLDWIEEAICADEPAEHWAELAMISRVPLAGGENVMGLAEFNALIRAGHLSVIQPDICKWGGLSGCRIVAARAVAAGLRYCPHWLNSGIGLHAAAHLLSAVGGTGMLEHDAMENPLQAVLAEPFPSLVEGCFTLTNVPGLGVEPNIAAARAFLVTHQELR
jgi:L-alanine-DL-glutamate epimerase-like enolase superfamily enzyme